MNRGVLRVVYVGTGFDLDMLFWGAATVETKDGHWATIKFKGRRNGDN
jgi:hypothetical protein